MAEPMTVRILDQLFAELQRITIANGFHTDLGLSVQRERTETGIPTAPRCTIAVTAKKPLEDRSKRGVAIEGLIEFVLPASMSNALDTVYRADDDVERVLSELTDRLVAGQAIASGALPPAYAESIFLDRPEGVPVVAAEITFTAGYQR